MHYQCQQGASALALSQLGPIEPSLELRNKVQALVRTTTRVLSCPPLQSPQDRGVKAGPVGWVPWGGAPSLAPCFPTCPRGGEGDRESGSKVVPQSHPHTFGLLATEAASIIPPPVLGACSTARGPRLSLLVPVGPGHLLVHVVGQVPHDADAVLHRLWGEESWWGTAQETLNLKEKSGHSQCAPSGPGVQRNAGPTGARTLREGLRGAGWNTYFRQDPVWAWWQARSTVWSIQGGPHCSRRVGQFQSVHPYSSSPCGPFLLHLPDLLRELSRLTLPGTCWDRPVPVSPPCCPCPSCPQLTEGHAGVRPPALHTPEVAAGPLRHLSSRSWMAKSKLCDPWLPRKCPQSPPGLGG